MIPKGGRKMTEFHTCGAKEDIDDLIFAELDYEVSRR